MLAHFLDFHITLLNGSKWLPATLQKFHANLINILTNRKRGIAGKEFGKFRRFQCYAKKNLIINSVNKGRVKARNRSSKMGGSKSECEFD